MTTTDAPYTLADGELRARLFGASFQLPSLIWRRHVRVGTPVKLIFELPPDEVTSAGSERMWVIVTRVEGHGASARYTGTLASDPTLVRVAYGDEVHFELRHITGTLTVQV